MTFFNDALRQDPRFALAFAGLSDASVAMYHDSADTKWATQAVYTAQQAGASTTHWWKSTRPWARPTWRQGEQRGHR